MFRLCYLDKIGIPLFLFIRKFRVSVIVKGKMSMAKQQNSHLAKIYNTISALATFAMRQDFF